MTMEDEDEIGRDLCGVDFFSERVRSYERIEKEGLAPGDDGETGVSVIGKLPLSI